MKVFSSEEYYPQFRYLMVALLVCALGGMTGRDGVLPALVYIIVAGIPIYKVKPRNTFLKYSYIPLAIIFWAICSVLVEGTLFDFKFSFFS